MMKNHYLYTFKNNVKQLLLLGGFIYMVLALSDSGGHFQVPHLFKKWYFIDYAITGVLIFPSLPPSGQYPPPNSNHCSCPWVTHISSLATPFPLLYFTSLGLFCNYLFVLLNPLTFHPYPQCPSHLAPIKTFSVSMILSLFFLFA